MRRRQRTFVRIAVAGLALFWSAVGWTGVALSASEQEKLGLGETVVAQLSYCRSEAAIERIAAIVKADGRDEATARMAREALCSTAHDVLIFTPLAVIDVFDVKDAADVDAYLVQLQLEGAVRADGMPVFYPDGGRSTLYAIAFRLKEGEAI